MCPVVCRMPAPVLLTAAEISAALSGLPGWVVESGWLVHEQTFPAYLDGVQFALRVAETAERQNHHPNIWIGWRRLRLSITTHSAGGLTELDFAFARAVQVLA